MVAKAVRRRGRRRDPDPRGAIAGGWDEYVDAGLDAGRSVPRSPTRREVADAFATPAGIRLAADADRAVFAAEEVTPDEVAAFWRIVDDERRVITRQRGFWRRVRAAVSLRSFLRFLAPRPPRRGRRIATRGGSVPPRRGDAIRHDRFDDAGVGRASSLALVVVLYVWFALALAAMFRKIGEPVWKAWVPVVNVATVLKLGGSRRGSCSSIWCRSSASSPSSSSTSWPSTASPSASAPVPDSRCSAPWCRSSGRASWGSVRHGGRVRRPRRRRGSAPSGADAIFEGPYVPLIGGWTPDPEPAAHTAPPIRRRRCRSRWCSPSPPGRLVGRCRAVARATGRRPPTSCPQPDGRRSTERHAPEEPSVPATPASVFDVLDALRDSAPAGAAARERPTRIPRPRPPTRTRMPSSPRRDGSPASPRRRPSPARKPAPSRPAPCFCRELPRRVACRRGPHRVRPIRPRSNPRRRPTSPRPPHTTRRPPAPRRRVVARGRPFPAWCRASRREAPVDIA